MLVRSPGTKVYTYQLVASRRCPWGAEPFFEDRVRSKVRHVGEGPIRTGIVCLLGRTSKSPIQPLVCPPNFSINHPVLRCCPSSQELALAVKLTYPAGYLLPT